MAVLTGIGAGTAGLAAGLAGLWAVAQGKDFSEGAKKVWEKTEEGLKNVGKGIGNFFDKLNGNGSGKTFKEITEETAKILQNEINKKQQEQEEPTKNENPNPNPNPNPNKISPGGIIAGATAGIKENVNNIIEDTTNQNIEQSIGGSFNDYMMKLEELQEKQWEREDTAYQRAVEDARLAGINVGALGGSIQPAQSTTNVMTSAGTTELNKIAEFLQQEIENNFKGDENEKDRFIQAIQMLFMYGLVSKK